jgi:hypothetical protein
MPIGARLLVSYYDFDSDYIHEVIIALKNKDNYFITVFRKQESKTTWGWAGDIVLEGCFNKPVFNNGELTIPIGSQGLFTTYTYYYGALVEDGSGLQTLISKLVETASSKASNRHPSSAIISIKLLNREKHESPEVITLQDKYSIVMKGKILGVNLYDVVVTTQGKLVKVGGDVIITNAVVLSDTKN